MVAANQAGAHSGQGHGLDFEYLFLDHHSDGLKPAARFTSVEDEGLVGFKEGGDVMVRVAALISQGLS